MNDYLEDMAVDCLMSYRSQVDQLIVCEDGGNFSERLRNISDIYAFNKDNVGFTKNVNRAWRLATGSYCMVVSSDTILMEGDIRDLCIPGKVTSPEVQNQFIEYLAGPFFVVPRTVKEERGMLLEEMRTYCSDSEYDHRVRDIFEKVDSVKIAHIMAQSVKAAGVEGGNEMQRDREAYAKLIREGKASA